MGNTLSNSFKQLGTKPIEGAKKEGFVGFVKGVGKSVVNVVTSPVQGFLGMVGKFGEGITSPLNASNDNNGDLYHVPRYFFYNGVIDLYDRKIAFGGLCLESIKRCDVEEDIDDCILYGKQLVILLTTHRLIRVSISREDLSDISKKESINISNIVKVNYSKSKKTLCVTYKGKDDKNNDLKEVIENEENARAFLDSIQKALDRKASK